MSSPFTSCEGNSSLRAREDELNKLSMSVSYDLSNSLAETGKNEFVIDQAIAGLKKCLQRYENKASSCENQLQNLGFPTTDLPEDLRTDLIEVYKDDDGVFNFPRSGDELVTINADYVLESLQENYELGQLRMLRSQMETLMEEHNRLSNSLQRKLNTERNESEKLENKRFEKEANLMILKQKLESAKWELDNVKQLSKGHQKPKYSVEEIESMKQEVYQLRTEIAHTDAKLKKYNKLPFSEKDAHKRLLKTKEDLKNIDNEIRTRVE